ncbi:peptide chain release factor 1 [candidate division WOR-3 bacterium RBG_13_43_14]|uniref:Peptide chain release factor 1 n=1 Tax=candidate division WOR-3 bacterium RBG_13_43_14 TaxID=1802590 RepID=A0A1F4U4D5_UNCW3|nr:MAG: peptide chain release factor 1 [candidate division WOR-3 bacterium RBG_13_43_14]
MVNRLEKEKRLKELSNLLANPDLIKNQREYASLSKEYKKLGQILMKYNEKDQLEKEIQDLFEMIRGSDTEIKEMAESELTLLQKKLSNTELEIAVLSNPKLAEYDKNCIVEIRAGAGGDEASLFAADLFRMYSKYCERRGLRLEVLSSHPSEIGGFKEIIFAVEGSNAYRHFHFEKGVHRVQRIPVTEAGGRIHTSTITVAVLPEIEETQFIINPNDLRIDTFRAGGHGGQNVNKVSSAVRLTHIPSGMVVVCQDERSQHKNRERAMKILRARLAALDEEKKQYEIDTQRRMQVGTGERSEKIRTYNYPQNRVTDHRIGLSLYNLDRVIEGELNGLIAKLEEHETAGAQNL